MTNFAVTPVMTYFTYGMKFQFVRDELLITDEANRRLWRLSFTRDPNHPFNIQLLNADVKEAD